MDRAEINPRIRKTPIRKVPHQTPFPPIRNLARPSQAVAGIRGPTRNPAARQELKAEAALQTCNAC